MGFNPGPNAAEGALSDLGIDPVGTYDSFSIDSIKAAAIEIMSALITTADTINSTVGFDIKYDRAAILKLIQQYRDDIGIVVSGRIIRGIHPW